MFTAVQKNRVYHDIVEQVRDAILQGKLKPGDRLPPERTLQDLFETSRITVREALRVLEHDGLLAIRTGSKGGAYVLEPSVGRVRESLSMLIEYRNVSLLKLAEFREDLEGSVTTLAALRSDKGDLKNLEAILSDFREKESSGIDSWSDCLALDDEFHLTLARAAHNVLYEIVLGTVHEHIGLYYSRFLTPDASLLHKNYEDLTGIYQAVKAGDSDRAALAARDHVESFNRVMIMSCKGKLDTVFDRGKQA